MLTCHRAFAYLVHAVETCVHRVRSLGRYERADSTALRCARLANEQSNRNVGKLVQQHNVLVYR